MSKTYRIHGSRYLRKYTAAERSSIYAYMSDVRKIANSLCTVPWERVVRDLAATTTIHTEEGIDWNEPERDRFDAAEWCGEHSDGFHRAFAQAACYVFELPDSAIGTSIEKLGIQVTSDPYNPYGARISAMTSATLDIPMDCATVREGEVYRAPDDDGMGAAPRLFMRNADGSQNWYANTEKVTLEPDTPLTAKKYLFVFCCLENYNRGRDGWIEGSSYIDNDIELTLATACEDLVEGEINDISSAYEHTEYNVTRGKVLPELTGDVSGVRAITIRSTGDPTTVTLSNPITPEQSCIGLRTLYAALYERRLNAVTKTVALAENAREGAGFSVQCEGTGAGTGKAWMRSNKTSGKWHGIAYGNGRFVAAGYNNDGLWYSDDCVTWTQSNKTDGDWGCVTFGNGRFVAGSDSNTGLWYSDDGVTWTQSRKTSEYWQGIAYGNGRFVAGNNIHGLWYSTDGNNWSQSNKTSGNWCGIGYGNGRFIAGGTNNNVGLWYSDNGSTWTQSNKTDGSFKTITYGNGRFVAGSYSDAGLWYSDNGSTWTQSRKTNEYFMAIAYGDGMFVAAARTYGLWRSDDGETWENHSVLNDRNNYSITYARGRFILGRTGDGLWFSYNDEIKSWRLTTAALLVPFAVPVSFRADKVRLDWSGWSGSATSGGKFNVWLKRGTFVQGYPESVLSNPAIYDATQKNVDGYELVGTIDSTQAEKTATFDLVNPIDGYVATILLTAFISLDDLNPSNAMNFPQGVATEMDVNADGSSMSGKGTGWKPDITLIG